MRSGRKLDGDAVSRLQDPAVQNDRHHPGLADQVPVRVAIEDRRHQTWLDPVELGAGVAESGQFDSRRVSQAELGSGREAEQVDAMGGYVLAHHSRPESETATTELVVELGVEEMDLTQVRLGRVLTNPRPMLDRPAKMSIALDTETREKTDLGDHRLHQSVGR